MRNFINLIENAWAVVEWKEMTGLELRGLVWGPDGKNFDLPFLRGSDFGNELHLGAWCDGRLVADAELKNSPSDPDEMWFMHIAVQPAFQNRGFGTVLAKWGFRTASQLGKKSLTISSYTEEGKDRLDYGMRKLAADYADELDIHFNSDGPRRRSVH